MTTEHEKLKIVAKRIARQMEAVRGAQQGRELFMGMGICMGIVYEEITGSPPQKKVSDILEWAKSLQVSEEFEKRLKAQRSKLIV